MFDLPRKFRLRPDLVVRRDSAGTHPVVIMDTKWKRLNCSSSSNYGISQNDMYQMYAYSKKYNTSDIWLIYPINDDVQDLDSLSFIAVEDEQTRVNVNIFFVELKEIENSLTDLYQRVYDM